MNTKSKVKGITMKVEQVGKTQDKTLMIYEMPCFEDKGILKQLFDSFLDNMKVGETIQAWKFYDTTCNYKFVKKVNDNFYHFKAC